MNEIILMSEPERGDMKHDFFRSVAGLLVFTTVAVSAFTVAPDARAEALHDMQGHDMGTVTNMDHSAMSNMEPMSGMEGMESMQPAAPTESRTPIPALTDADRQAAFPDVHGHKVHDSSVNGYLLADKLEWQKNNKASGFSWDVSGWVGGDIERLWLRSEGELSDGKTESAEVQALWGHAISPWWDVVAGARQDFKPGRPLAWAAAGFQGMQLYNLETELTAFVSEQGRTALRFEAEYDMLLTSRLILQPSFEANFYGKDDRMRETGKGLSATELSLRLRYEVKREFAPYMGVSWRQLYGNTANIATCEGEQDNEFSFLLGARVWF